MLLGNKKSRDGFNIGIICRILDQLANFKTNISFPLRSHSIRFSTGSYSFKIETDSILVMMSKEGVSFMRVLIGQAK